MRSDMNEWTEIRRKVLVEHASKRSVMTEYGLGFRALEKISSPTLTLPATGAPSCVRSPSSGRSW